MAGAPEYSEREVFVLAYSVALWESQEETYERHRRAFPHLDRGRSGISAMRSHDRVKQMLKRIVKDGADRVHTQLGLLEEGAGVPGAPLSVETSTHPDGSLSITAPKADQWTRPIDLLNRMGIAYELDDLGQPIPLLYEVPKIRGNEWGTAMKGEDGRPITVPNWQCRLDLIPRKEAPVLRTMQRLLDGVTKIAPEPPPPPKLYNTGHMLEAVMPDLHFGKLAHADETGENLDTKIIDLRARQAFESMVTRGTEKGVDRCVLVVGNDALNADNAEGTTTRGTRQDQDSRLYKTVDRLADFYVWAINRMREVAEVHVYCVPGNHDREMARMVAKFLSAWFRKDEHVQIDTSPMVRKYARWGVVGLGWVHGDAAKPKDLPGIMSVEAPWWSQVKVREIHTGHMHRVKVEEFIGCTVREFGSLTGNDAWHSLMGYRAMKQADALVWHKDRGLRDIIVEQDFA